MSWFKQIYLGLPCEVSQYEHELQFGAAPPGFEYVCYGLPFPPAGEDIGSIIYAQVMANIYRVAVEWHYGTPQTNMAVTTHDWLFTPDGNPSETQWTTIEGRIDSFATAINGLLASGCTIDSYRWRELNGDGSGPETPTIRFTEKSIGFAGGNMAPPQVACSVTEMTDVRRRWGRFYLPFIGSGLMSNGRIESQFVNTIAQAGAGLLTTSDPDWTPVVYGAIAPTILPIQSVRVDDVPDIIRSRRWSGPTVRSTIDVTP